MKSESGATEKPYFLMSNDYCWDFVIDRFPPSSSRAKNHHCGIKLGSYDDDESDDNDDEMRG